MDGRQRDEGFHPHIPPFDTIGLTINRRSPGLASALPSAILIIL